MGNEQEKQQRKDDDKKEVDEAGLGPDEYAMKYCTYDREAAESLL